MPALSPSPASRLRRLTAAALLVAGLVVSATACASPPAPEPTTPGAGSTSTIAPSEPAQSPDPDETGGAIVPEDVTCESLIGADLVTELTDQGWTVREDPFLIGDVELTDGISCTWGDFDAENGDNLLLFGWSPITADEASTAQAALESEGWIVEDAADGVYVTEDPAQAIAVDDEGYGVTYLFGDGWVLLSDTKQGLVLIERPGA